MRKDRPDHSARAGARVGRIYGKYAPLLMRVATRKFNVPGADARELVDDVFVGWIVSSEEITNLEGYLIGSLCDVSRRYWSERAPEKPFVCDHSDIAKFVDDVERVQRFTAALSMLASPCREILRRNLCEREAITSIAAAMQLDPLDVQRLLQASGKRACAIYGRLTREPSVAAG